MQLIIIQVTAFKKTSTLIFIILHCFKPALSSRSNGGKESPDSIEQPAGEQPGPTKIGTESATENNCPDFCQDEGENVR